MAAGCGVFHLCLVTTMAWGILECLSYTRPETVKAEGIREEKSLPLVKRQKFKEPRDSRPLMATKDGDIIIGGIFPVHESVDLTDIDERPSKRTCSRFSVSRIVQTLMLIEAVETINNSLLLGNLTLGYRIVDSCSDVTTAIYVTQRFLDADRTICQDLWKTVDGNHWNKWLNSPLKPVDVVIGEYYSEISIAVARQLSIHMIPQISYASTTGLLSDKNRFPVFMRTVPEDRYQAHAIVDILKKYGWDWVGLVTTDGDYGRYLAKRFQERAKEKGVCIAFRTELPDILSDSDLKDGIMETIKNIESDRRIGVIVSFAKPYHMKDIMKNLNPNATGRIWLASDNWALAAHRVLESSDLTLKDTGNVIGVTLKSATSASFHSYLNNLNPNSAAHENNNTILHQYLLELKNKGQNVTQPDLSRQLKKLITPSAVFSVGLAVKAIASAVRDLCRHRDCKADKHFEPWMLKNALRNTTFHWEPNGTEYKFDENGDLNTGYDLILWKQNGQQVDMNNIIATYSIQSEDFSFTDGGESQIANLVDKINSSCPVVSCPPGTRKIIPRERDVCCFSCENCTKDKFTNVSDMRECLDCAPSHWSNEGSQECQEEEELFFDWQEPFAIILVSFSVLGIVLTLAVLVLFLLRWKTPVVKASVGPASILLLISLLGTFVSTVLYVGKPDPAQCQARQLLFGLSFTLAVSCVLVKSLKIVLAFRACPLGKLATAKRFYLIIPACVSVQVAICAAWLANSPPRPKRGPRENGKVVLLCEEGEGGNFLYFGLMLGYIGVLSLAGFAIAFKGRKLPHCYNEAKCISFGLLIYIICWVLFGPIYAHAKAGAYQPAVEIIVILFSAYSLLGTVFLPKSYTILFRRETNTREAFRLCLREHNIRGSLEPPSTTQLASVAPPPPEPPSMTQLASVHPIGGSLEPPSMTQLASVPPIGGSLEPPSSTTQLASVPPIGGSLEPPSSTTQLASVAPPPPEPPSMMQLASVHPIGGSLEPPSMTQLASVPPPPPALVLTGAAPSDLLPMKRKRSRTL